MTLERCPSVTFLILTYRQQDYVANAIGGALSQDYENLQIIISDDCSPDQTYEAAKNALNGYTGRHRVVLRQTAQNIGLIAHLYEAAKLADGDLIVVAAGDDVSYPKRVSSLVQAWRETGATAICSKWDICNQAGEITICQLGGGKSELRFRDYFPSMRFTQITGASAAYTREVFEIVDQPPPGVFAEDLYFSLVLQYLGHCVTEVQESLLKYREHADAMTNHGSLRSVVDHELFVERQSRLVADLLDAVAHKLIQLPRSDRKVDVEFNLEAVQEDVAFNRFRASWTSAGLLSRMGAFMRFTLPVYRRWLGPRLFGLRFFSLVKGLRGS